MLVVCHDLNDSFKRLKALDQFVTQIKQHMMVWQCAGQFIVHHQHHWAVGQCVILRPKHVQDALADKVIEKVQQRIAEMMPELIRDAVDQVLKEHEPKIE